MATFIIQIVPKSPDFDPAAKGVRSELLESGQTPVTAAVATRRLYRIEGNFTLQQMEQVAKTLLVDPVVEISEVEEVGASPAKLLAGKPAKAPKKKETGGHVMDVWPKPGVTDPVGDTVVKGLRDLGFSTPAHASTAMRYVFPKITSVDFLKNLAKRSLANELIHDIHIRKI